MKLINRTIWLGLFFALLLSGCNVATNADEMLVQIEKCEDVFKGKCSLIAVPDNGEDDMRSMYIKWMDND